MRWLVIGGTVFLLGFNSAAAQMPPPPNYAPVPPPRMEQMPPPRPNMVWEPGHWHWDGYRYLWVGGHYVHIRPQYHRWVGGHWAWMPPQGRYVWVPAHWE